MKIGEILDLTKTEPLEKIATVSRLGMSKEKARKALLKAGCNFKKGVRGWFLEGDPAVLEQSIFDFAEDNHVISAEKEVSATIQQPRLENIPTSQLSNKTDKKKVNKTSSNKNNKQVNKPTDKQPNNPSMKKVTYEIEEQLHDELKIMAIREKRTVSEIVNEIIKRGVSK